MKRVCRYLLVLGILIIAGCSSSPRKSYAPPVKTELSDPIMVIAQLREQLSQWYGTPYHYGGMDMSGIDCSGFVYRTFYDRFAISLPRTTKAQTTYGTRISVADLQPGDLVFFKTGGGENGLHVGIYDSDNAFIHASTSKGVMRSSLNSEYWHKAFWQARRI